MVWPERRVFGSDLVNALNLILYVVIGNFGHNLNLKFKCDQVRNRQPLPQSVKQAMAMSIFIWLLWLKTSLGHRAL